MKEGLTYMEVILALLFAFSFNKRGIFNMRFGTFYFNTKYFTTIFGIVNSGLGFYSYTFFSGEVVANEKGLK